MIIIDTMVLSELMRPNPGTDVVEWLDKQPSESIWTTSVCVFEVMYSIQSLPRGKRRNSLNDSFRLILKDDLQARVLDFDSVAAYEAATIAAKLRAKGRPVESRDVLIAGIVAARRGILATRNVKQFTDSEIQVVNPWDATSA